MNGAALEPALIDSEARGIKPETLLGDSHYGSEEGLAGAAKGSKQGELTLEDFDLDERGHVT
jgi:hypothetical protein